MKVLWVSCKEASRVHLARCQQKIETWHYSRKENCVESNEVSAMNEVKLVRCVVSHSGNFMEIITRAARNVFRTGKVGSYQYS